jgi:hypothetical protein
MLLSVVDVYFNKFKDTMIRLNYFRSVAKHAMKWWQNKIRQTLFVQGHYCNKSNARDKS